MRILKHFSRCVLFAVTVLVIRLCISYPYEVVTAIVAILYFITVWHLVYRRRRGSPQKKGKDRTFRYPPWV